MISNRVKKSIIILISASIILAISAMIVGNAWFTVYSYDDFDHAISIGVFHGSFSEHLHAAWAFAKKMYFWWQGTYFSMFIQGLLSPINGGGLPQLRAVMLFNAVLFLSSFVFFLNILFLYFSNAISIEKRLLMIALIFLQLFTSLEYPEIFSWFSGSTCYSFPLSFLFISVSLTLIAEKRHKILLLIPAVIFGFLGMGGVLAITGMGCAFMLLLFLIPIIFEKMINKYISISFASYLIFAIFATVAPGNFRRRGAVEASFSVIKAIFLTSKKYFYGVESLFKDTGFIVICLIFVVIGILLGRNIEKEKIKRYTVASLLALVIPFATLFPIILGYGGYTYFPNRCYFLMNLSLTLVLLNISILIGCIISNHLEGEDTYKVVLISMATIAMACLLTNPKRMEENVGVIQINNLANGRIKAYYNECNDLLEYIKNCPEEDVVIEHMPDYVPHYVDFYLSQDETYWINVDIATLSGKNTVRVK